MERSASRRSVLRSALAIGTVGGGLGSGLVGSVAGGHEGFDPTRHAFGFENWSSRTQTFESPNPQLSVDDVSDRFGTAWVEHARSILGLQPARFSEALVGTMSTQLRETIVQNAGTNGHCYGMALAAQRYYERPETIPVPRETAAAISHPIEPLEDPSAPVYDDITDLQAEQFIRFRAWLGRRAMLYPDRIDLEAQLADVRAVVDAFDTAVVSVLDDRLSGHQVLVHDYEDRSDGTSLHVYDPNISARRYEYRRQTIELERTDDSYRMEPYRQYTHLLFNRYDRIEQATDRVTASPLDHLEVEASQLREELFPTALVTVDTTDVDLSVSRPSDRPLGRLRGAYMDSSRGAFPRLRCGYGISAGEYRIAIVGSRETDYQLRVRIAEPAGARVDETRYDRIESGETHTYVVEVPESADETGTVQRVEGESGLGRLAAVGAGGAAIGAGAYHVWRRTGDGDSG